MKMKAENQKNKLREDELEFELIKFQETPWSELTI